MVSFPGLVCRQAEELENEELIQSLDDLLFSATSDDSKLRVLEEHQDSDSELGAVGATKRKRLSSSSLDEDEQDFDTNDLKDFLDDMMIQTSNMPFQHPRTMMPPNYGAHHSANNLFQSPYYHPHHHHPHHHHVSRRRVYRICRCDSSSL